MSEPKPPPSASSSLHALARNALLFSLVVVSSFGAVALADPGPAPDSGHADARTLAQALDQRLTVWTTPRGRRVHVSHCRYAKGGCPARIEAFAQVITHAAEQNGLDAFLLAAVAMRESGFDPAAIGAAGERGIVQLHPRGAGARVRYVRDDRYRERCLRQADACQGEVVDVGATLLAEAIQHCGGLERGLGMYNAGRCDETRDYVRRVLAERERLRSSVAIQ